MTSLSQFNSRAEDLGGNPQYRGVVLSIHGLNTTGGWQKFISPILQDSGLRYIPVDYGYVALRVALPRWILSRATQALFGAYDSEYYKYENLPFCAIGHSFGTLAIGCLINDNRDIVFDRVILSGCIMREDYPWGKIFDREQVNGVLNEISENDNVVRICTLLRCMSWKLPVGRAGRFGFSSEHSALTQRSQIVKHSGGLSRLACKRSWVPFLLGETVRISE